MKVSERDLRSDAPSERFGLAIMKCEGYTPACWEAERCERDGECFVSPPHLVAARMIENLLPGRDESGLHFYYIRKCVDMLRAGRLS